MTGLPVAGAPEQNLVGQAFRLLSGEFPEKVKGLSVYLHKVIPMGAGMGGGSADAAFMLEMMNEHFELGINAAGLKAYALQLGSDCPFFYPQPAGLCRRQG